MIASQHRGGGLMSDYTKQRLDEAVAAKRRRDDQTRQRELQERRELEARVAKAEASNKHWPDIEKKIRMAVTLSNERSGGAGVWFEHGSELLPADDRNPAMQRKRMMRVYTAADNQTLYFYIDDD